MTVLHEGELEFRFIEMLHAEKFDVPGKKWPKGMSPVDFLVENDHEVVLVEIKDPSALNASKKEREKFQKKMQTKELSHQELVPKARGTYSFLHLMKRDKKPMRLVVVIGTERLSIQPPLLMNLTDQLRKRLKREVEKPWCHEYMPSCNVITLSDFSKVFPGCSVRRK